MDFFENKQELEGIVSRLVKTAAVFVFILSTVELGTQYHLAQSQFTRNEALINPAYSASKDYYTLAANVREQWTGIEGAPATQSVYAFGTLPHRNVGLGISIINDAIGISKQQLFNFSYAYKLNFNHSFLSMGLNGGAKSVSSNFNELTLESTTDVKFTASSRKYHIPYLGTGIYFEKDNYNLGFSVPIFLDNIFGSEDVELLTEERIFFFLSGAYLGNLNNGWALKTGSLIRGALRASVEIDVLATLYINDAWNFGLMYKSLNSIGVHLEYGLNKQFYFTYSYDFATSQMIHYQYGTHEITITYLIDKMLGRYYKNPKYF